MQKVNLVEFKNVSKRQIQPWKHDRVNICCIRSLMSLVSFSVLTETRKENKNKNHEVESHKNKSRRSFNV